ncbi:hypothetical protein [Halomonas sp. N3-2A]|uniref:hypothetical protein n=1 Tax=Halomonas sp. N3-2A TaxID=2014541 RepID=UPI000B5B229F|nr:hypothetical protein [Halomonas sp. N3-2A]ASK18392.1 hypothetical protein CEK60_03305 [Halomonas sp. N3-2A]
MSIVRFDIHDDEMHEMAKGEMPMKLQITQKLIEQGFCFAEFATEAAALDIDPKPSHPMEIWRDELRRFTGYQQEIPG